MYKWLYFSFTLLIAVIFSIRCTTKDGEIFSFNPQYGNLLITSDNFSGARIFLDYKDTGKQTPALFENITVGRHIVHLFLSTTKATPDSAVVLVEKGKEQTVRFELNRVSSGDILINTTPDSARLLINKLDFGFTPANVLGLPEGNYQLEIIKSNYVPIRKEAQIRTNTVYQLDEQLTVQRVVLLEHMSNTSCPPCPQADALIEDLMQSYGSAILTGIGYHAFWPSEQDPMYLSAKAGNDYRIKEFYRPSKIPTAWINGIEVNNSLDEQSYRALIDNELQKSTPAVIEILQIDREDSLLYGVVKIRAMEDLPSETVLQIALIEDVIDYENPPGTNGQTHFEAVFRKFYPEPVGQIVNLLTNQKYVTNFKFIFQEDWGRDLAVVVFLQKTRTKEVLQSAWTRFPPL